MKLPSKIHFSQSFFNVIRRDRASCTLYLRFDVDAFAEAERDLKNDHSNPFLSYRDKTRYINESNKSLLGQIQAELPTPLTAEEIRSQYVLVENYVHTCG